MYENVCNLRMMKEISIYSAGVLILNRGDPPMRWSFTAIPA